MVAVYVSIGSNVERETNVKRAVAALRRRYGSLALSSVYESAPVGFAGDDFYNLVVRFETDEDVDAVIGVLRSIESEQSRDRRLPRYGPRTVDLDLLLYGRYVGERGGVRLPRAEISHRGFVLRPLAELAGEETHPVSGETFGELWRRLECDEGPGVRPVKGAGCLL